MRLLIGLLLAVALLGGVTPPSSAGVSKKQLKQAIEEFNREFRSARSPKDLLPFFFVEYRSAGYAVSLPRRFLRLAQEGETFHIEKVKYHPNSIQLRLLSARGAKVAISVHDRDRLGQAFADSVVTLALSEVFVFGDTPPAPRYVGNQQSFQYHLRGCNHLPPREKRQMFARTDDAEGAGFKACPVCFAAEQMLPIGGYGPMRAEALEDARLREIASPPVDDPVLQARVQRTGESIVDGLPVDPKGFEYVFKVLHSELPNALSLPTGFVYITDKLMTAMEDSLELEFVLAHEIAHTEFHRTISFDTAPTTIEAIRYQWELAYERQRFQEVESDLLALLFLTREHGTTGTLERARGVLAKMQFAAEAVEEVTEADATHPSLDRRMDFFDPRWFVVADSRRSFCALDKNGEVLARVTVIGRSEDRKMPKVVETGTRITEGTTPYVVYFLVEATDLLNEPIRKTRGKIEDESGRTILLQSSVVPFMVPPGGAGVIPLRVAHGSASLTSLKSVEIDIPGGVDRWTVEGETEQ